MKFSFYETEGPPPVDLAAEGAEANADEQEPPSSDNHEVDGKENVVPRDLPPRREEGLSLDVAAVFAPFTGSPVDNVDAEESSLVVKDVCEWADGDSNECLETIGNFTDDVLDNMDEICQPLAMSKSNCCASELNGDGPAEATANAVEGGSGEEEKEQESPSEEPEDQPPSPSAEDGPDRSARLARFMSVHLGTMENLAVLKNYHALKRTEATLLEKHSLGAEFNRVEIDSFLANPHRVR